MITGELKNQIDRIWDTFWSGGISNPIDVIEQMTFLLFLKRLDELHTAEEKKAARLGREIDRPIFTKKNQKPARWSAFKQLEPNAMYEAVRDVAFPFMKNMGSEGSAYSRHMKDALFKIPTAALLAKVVDMIGALPLDDRDTKGDVYEYMLSKVAVAGVNGQFRTPRHIIRMMVELVAPRPTDTICDPACGTAGFLVAAGEYLRRHHEKEIFADAKLRRHFMESAFHGYDFDSTMLRIGSMNMMLHGIEQPDITYRDSLGKDHADEEERFTVLLANPPFKGSLDESNCSPRLLQLVKTKKTELLFVALFLRLLKKGGRAAVIVPDGVLFGSSNAHKAIRRELVERQKLDAVISMPSGVFKPYAGVSTAVLVFTRTDCGTVLPGGDAGGVWFYDMEADGFSLDDKRTELDHAKHKQDNLPDILKRWPERAGKERKRARTEQSFIVPRAEIAGNDYDLSVSRYREVEHAAADHKPPREIIAELKQIEAEIATGLDELAGMLR